MAFQGFSILGEIPEDEADSQVIIIQEELGKSVTEYTGFALVTRYALDIDDKEEEEIVARLDKVAAALDVSSCIIVHDHTGTRWLEVPRVDLTPEELRPYEGRSIWSPGDTVWMIKDGKILTSEP